MYITPMKNGGLFLTSGSKADSLYVNGATATTLSMIPISTGRRRSGYWMKALRFEADGFLLATKKLLPDMRFQCPKTPEEVRDITPRQVRWLLEGLSIEQKLASGILIFCTIYGIIRKEKRGKRACIQQSRKNS